MKIICIVGQKNAGKTTFISDFIRWLASQNYKVGSIKFSPHRHNLDEEGKDSYRHRKSGALKSAFITPEGFALFQETPDISTSKAFILSQYQDLDIVIIEGNLELQGKKLEVFEYNTENRQPYALENTSIHALISSSFQQAPCPIIHPSNFTEILAFAESIS